MSHIFVSHASADDTVVTRIHDEVEAATKAALWVDHEDIATGANWQQAIDRALADASHMILVISRTSVTREEVMAEWRDALLRGVPVLPALIDDLPLLDIPARLRLIQPVNLHADWARGIGQLASAITGVSAPDGSPAPHFTRRKITARPPIPRELIAIPMRGRESSYDEALACLRDAPTTLEGVGGLGKSRLAAEIVANSPDVDEAIWLRLGETTTDDALAERLREHYAQPNETDWPVLLALVKAGARLLIVLDNAESIGQPERRAAFVERIEALHAAGAQILLTSRAAWPELRGGKHVHPTALASEEATAAVPDMARFHDARQADISARADDIAREARNHPRLIEWAVGQMTHLPVTVVLGWLADVNNPDLQGALDDMIGRTLREMTAAEGDDPAWALRRLNVTQGGFTWEAARALCILNDANAPIPDERALAAALQTLQRWQFVTMDAQGRFAIDPMAAAVVTADEEARRPHYDFYLALAREHDRRQDYLGLDVESANLDAAFEWAMGDDAQSALWLANAAALFLLNRGRFAQILVWHERVVTALEGHPDRMLWANAQNSLGNDLHGLSIGDRRENLRRAVTAYEQALRFYTPEVAPLDYAATQNNLGAAYKNLATLEDRGSNLRRAVTAYEQALRFRTPETAPLDYAMTQNNLGNAYSDLAALEDRAGNLRRAVATYEQALRFRTPEAAPLDYAMTQNNLGAAYWNLSEVEDRAGNLRRAVTAYEQALRFYTPEAAPLAYAMTQNNLGNAYRNRAALEDRADNLRRSVTAYEQALRFFTPEAAPLDYATTQNNLGAAYRDLSEIEDRAGNLRRTVTAYEQALRFYTPEAAPLDYAMTQANLGLVLRDLGEQAKALELWREAIRIFESMGMMDYAARVLVWIADAEGGEDEGGE